MAMNKNHIKNISISIGICIICIVIIPILINILILKPRLFETVGTSTDWLSFWGGYIGAIISTCTAFLILYIQRRDNKKDNEYNRKSNETQNDNNRKLQLNIMKYHQQSSWLENFINTSLELYNAFNHNDIIMITNIILNHPNEAFNMMKPLFDRIDSKYAKFSFIRKQDDQANKLANDIYQVYVSYRQALNDLQWIALYLKGSIEPNLINKTHFINYIQNQASINKNASHFTQRLYQSNGCGYDYFNNMLRIINAESSTFEGVVRDKMYEYIRQEQQRIDNILTENLN